MAHHVRSFMMYLTALGLALGAVIMGMPIGGGGGVG
jgi:hypothetical protein